MRYKDNLYSFYSELIRNKDKALINFFDETLQKTASMFEYSNLPDTIPYKELEHILQTTGHAFITEVNGKLYALRGTLGGQPDEYERPTQITVANVALNLTKSFDVRTDGVLITNNSVNTSLMPLIGQYGILVNDTLLSLNVVSVLSRITLLLTASDIQSKKAAEEFTEKILKGEFSVIGDSAFFEGVKMQTAGNTVNSTLQQLIETLQYFKSSFYNSLGLRSNWNVKRERLNLGEIETNEDITLPQIDDMLFCRVDGLKRLNDKYGLDCGVTLSSSWKLNHENAKMIDDLQPDEPDKPQQPDEPDKKDEPDEPDKKDDNQ